MSENYFLQHRSAKIQFNSIYFSSRLIAQGNVQAAKHPSGETSRWRTGKVAKRPATIGVCQYRYYCHFSQITVFNALECNLLSGNILTKLHPDRVYLSQRQLHLTPWTLVASTKSETGFESGFPDLSGFLCPPDRSQNVLDPFPCRRQSSRRVPWKVDGDCTRNANKSPKMPCPVVKWGWK